MHKWTMEEMEILVGMTNSLSLATQSICCHMLMQDPDKAISDVKVAHSVIHSMMQKGLMDDDNLQ